MALKPGTSITLPIVRETEFGYFLHAEKENEDILLHEREVTRPITVGEYVEVYLYHDSKGRIAATMEEPILQKGEMAWLEVVSIKKGHGLFCYNGISRDLFVSIDELPLDRNVWPIPKDRLPLSITWDKRGRVMGKIVRGEEMEAYAEKAPAIMRHKEVYGVVYQYVSEGARIFTDDKYLAFLHEDEMTIQPRIGEYIRTRVTFVREDGRINVTTKPLRSVQQEMDAEEIYAYLKDRDGAMPYSDDTSPDIIRTRFKMSKGAFKRALGKLMKERKIEQREGWTYLKE